MTDLYQLLGIDRNATNAEIKTAYKRLAAQYHPDRNALPEAEEKFKEINEAYQVLSDFYLRLQYEKELDASLNEAAPEQKNQTTVEEFNSTEEKETVAANADNSTKTPATFGIKWKLAALVAAPIMILVGIGVMKLFATTFDDTADKKKVTEPQKQVVVTEKPVKESPRKEKLLSIWDLKRMAVATPDACILYLDSLKATPAYQEEMGAIREKAVAQLPSKTAYYFETNECEQALISFQLLAGNAPQALTPHLRKQLDFYHYRCVLEANQVEEALAILEDMENRYQHQFSIVAAKAELMLKHFNQPKEALKLYQKARLLQPNQQIDQKFLKYWKPDFNVLNAATIIANEAALHQALGSYQKAKQTALAAIKLDSTQALPYEVIGNSFIREDNAWGACKYWHLALENGSSHAADSILKYCEN